ncbi:MAG: hypothetical protein WKG52_04495 [Variovorax sp.]
MRPWRSRAKPGDDRVFHRLAERERVGKVALGAQAPARVARQQHQHRHQRDRDGGDQRGQQIGEDVRRGAPAVDPQHHGGAGQVDQQLRREDAGAHAARGTDRDEPRAVGLGERDFLAAGQGGGDQLGQRVAQR